MTDLLHQVQEEYPHPPGAYWVPRRLGGGAPTLAEAAQVEAGWPNAGAGQERQPHAGESRERGRRKAERTK